jgi:alpha/beta superfamily hydrolase
MNAHTVKHLIPGPAGLIEVALDAPQGRPVGCALLCHPHPLGGGTMDNKVVHTLVRAFLQMGVRTIRFNFRGVGRSQGQFDEGRGEVDDALAVWQACREPNEAWWLAGFSFGAFIAASLAQRLPASDQAQRLALVGPSTARQLPPAVPEDTVVIHGELDEIVPLQATLDWARPQSLPVTVFPGVGHFFHGQLALLRTVLVRQLQDSVGDIRRSEVAIA